jgi:hypothetical protein
MSLTRRFGGRIPPRPPSLHPRGPGNTWTPEQWGQILYLARVAAGTQRSGCIPRTAMRSLREYADAATGSTT